MIAAPVFGLQSVIGKFTFHAFGIDAGFIDLVDGDDHRNFRRLWCAKWIRSVCGITPSSAATTRTTISVTFAPRARISVNASWPGVSRNVILRSLRVHLICADVLRDSAGFLFGDSRFADRIQQRRFSVIDVTHDGDDRSARDRIFRNADFDRIEHGAFFKGDKFGFGIEVLGRFLWPFPCPASD